MNAERQKIADKHRPFHLETREVEAAAYLGPNKGRTMLSHSVEVGADGMVIRVLCGRVSELSIADKYAQDTTLDPTCKNCLSKRKKWAGIDPGCGSCRGWNEGQPCPHKPAVVKAARARSKK